MPLDVTLAPYVPRIAVEWDLEAPGARWRQLDATCCFVDVSGFTALSERLAGRGRVGAEELTGVIDAVFGRMLEVAYDCGGSLLKFGGDALLLAFTTGEHPLLAAQAALAMRETLRQVRQLSTSVGRVSLRVSIGLHSGPFDFVKAGSSHRELLVIGPGATATTLMEQLADAGEIVVSEGAAARLPPEALGPVRATGRLLEWRAAGAAGSGPVAVSSIAQEQLAEWVPRSLRDHLARGGFEPEHRVASVGFVKFVGVDALLAEWGPEIVAGALDDLVCAAQRAAADEQVTFLGSDIDTDGGKLIFAAGALGALEDDEGRLLRLARRLISLELPLRLRVGLNRGHVFCGEIGTTFRRTYTLMGDTVNLAARLMGAATSGEVLATGGILDASRSAFRTQALPPLVVKGKSEPVQAFRVGDPVGPKPYRYGALAFTGRDKELAALADAFDRTRRGSGGAVVIEGERGAGKTRLVTEFVRSLVGSLDAPGGGVAMIELRGEPSATAIPYLALAPSIRLLLGIDAAERAEAGRQLLARLRSLRPALVPLAPLLAPIVGADVPPTPESGTIAAEYAAERIAGLVVELLEASCAGQLVVVADDAQWLDDTTSGICARLEKAAASRPWLVCAVRHRGPGGFRAAEPLLHLELSPLLDDAALELVERATSADPLRPYVRDRLVARAGGNPLFLEELLGSVYAMSAESLPDSLEAIAMREIDSLPAASRRVLRLASVIGRSFDRQLLEQFLDAEDSARAADVLEELSLQLWADAGGQLRFRNAVLRDAAYQSLPFRTRLRLHLDLADAIERSATSPEVAAPLLSHHLLAAREWDRAWVWARAAASVARDLRAPAEVATHLERAVLAAQHLRSVAGAELASALFDLAATRELLGEYEAADDAYRRAARADSSDALLQARVADRRAYVRSEFLGRPAAALGLVRRAMGALAAASAAVERGRLAGGETASTRPPGEPSPEWAGAQLLAREADIRMRQGKLELALRRARRAAAQARQASNNGALALSLYALDACYLQLGRVREATHLDQVLDLYRDLDDRVHIAITLGNLAGAAFFASQWERAAELAVLSAQASKEVGDLAGAAIAELNLGELRVNQGRLEEALALLGPARRTLASFGYRVMTALATMQLGRARAFAGDVASGTAAIESAIDTFDSVGSALEALEARGRLGEVLVFAGRQREAADVLETARQLASGMPETSVAALLERVELTLLLASGRRDDFSSALPLALERARRLGADYDRLVLLALAARHDAGPQPGEASRLTAALGVVRLAVLPPG